MVTMWDEENIVTVGYNPQLKYAENWFVELNIRGTCEMFVRTALAGAMVYTAVIIRI